jgi:hypothetical protein
MPGVHPVFQQGNPDIRVGQRTAPPPYSHASPVGTSPEGPEYLGYALAASSCEEANCVEYAPSRPLMRSLLSQFQTPTTPRRAVGFFGSGAKLCTLHRSWIAPCSTLGSRRYTRIAPWSTLSVLCWPRISPCPTLRSMRARRLLRVRRLMLAPFADCSALDTWRSMPGPDRSVPCILRPALVADCSVPIALRLRFACGLLRSQPVRRVPHTDCSVHFLRRCAPLMDFSTLDTWRSHRARIAPRSTLDASCFLRIAPLSTLGVLC